MKNISEVLSGLRFRAAKQLEALKGLRHRIVESRTMPAPASKPAHEDGTEGLARKS